jgi:hypothetical protein
MTKTTLQTQVAVVQVINQVPGLSKIEKSAWQRQLRETAEVVARDDKYSRLRASNSGSFERS